MLWSERFDGENPHEGYVPQAMAMDHAGAIIITGYIVMTETSDTFTIKYDSDGKLLWFARYAGHASEFPNAIAVDRDNDIYIVGSGFLIIKYDSSGTQEWLHMYDGPVAAYDVVIDQLGNIDVAGGIYNYDTEESDFLTLQYTSDGDKLWERRFSGEENGSESPVAMSLDADGNIYVTGTSVFNRGLKRNCYTLKYSMDGEEQWVVKYEGDGHREDTPRAMALDDSSNVYVALRSVLGPSRSTYTILKYRQSQNLTHVDASAAHPAGFQLYQNYPNPFNPETTIEYDISQPAEVTLTIYNVMGQAVRTLVRAFQPAGNFNVSWDGKDGSGQVVASGVYVYELSTGEQVLRKKVVLIR